MATPLKVLVVDDEPDIVEILTYNLKKENYQVFAAYNGEEAIQSAGVNHPDLIIMDIRMPGISGIEACRIIKHDDKVKDIPVLFLTADSDEYTTMNAIDAGGDHFITKPIRPSLLIGMIKELVQKA
ncbi:MAG TPA: response regulator [Bacteroidia bacterium]|nr:response regulator [Bacteroidia bacterium]